MRSDRQRERGKWWERSKERR